MGPKSTDTPPSNLYNPLAGYTGPGMGPAIGMYYICIPRHGKQPRPIPRYWPQNQPLPGAVNVYFVDGHAQTVKLDDLWQIYWQQRLYPAAQKTRSLTWQMQPRPPVPAVFICGIPAATPDLFDHPEPIA